MLSTIEITGENATLKPLTQIRRKQKKALTEVRYQLDKGSYQHDLKKKTFEGYVEDWLKRKTKIRENTGKGYGGYFQNHMLPYFGGIVSNNITRQEIHNFIGYSKGKGLSPRIIHNTTSYKGKYSDPETTYSKRKVDLPGKLAGERRTYCQERSLEFFCTKKGYILRAENLLNKHFYPALESAGLKRI